MRQITFGLVALLVLGLASIASAAPIYRDGNECPADSDGPFLANGSTYSRQYSVEQATACMFTDGQNDQVQGSDQEADDYLNTLLASNNGWGSFPDSGDDWEGLGQSPAGFSYDVTAVDSENKPITGTFSIDDPLYSQWDQFAIAVKDGGDTEVCDLPVACRTVRR